jgi:Lrp/AsnC family transcriptional regulator for asnA, asnC and gidA
MSKPKSKNTGRTGPLDHIDRRIIAVLQENGRTSNREVGRLLGISEATVRNRISRLTDEDLINIVAVPTPRAVSLPMMESVVDELMTQPEVRYVGMATGRYDVIIEAFFHDQEHLLEFLSKRLGHMDGVTSVETSLILRVAKFSYEWEIPVE